MTAQKRNTTFRLDIDLEARIEAIRDAAAKRVSGPFAMRPEKSTVLRALLEAGATVFEAQLGITPPATAGAVPPEEEPAPDDLTATAPRDSKVKRGGKRGK